MSFLNSILSSIGCPDAPPPIPPVTTPKPTTPKIGTDINGKKPSVSSDHSRTNSLSSGVKRKAEDEIARPGFKPQSTEPNMVRSSSTNGTATKPVAGLKPNLQAKSLETKVPYRGTSKPSTVSPVSPSSKGPPKKGSYAEIMARSKAAQAVAPTVGAIKHVPKEKLSAKKELKMIKKGLVPSKATGPIGSTNGSKSSSPATGTHTPNSLIKDKKAPPTGYQGTAKPKPQPTYKGTMKPKPTSGPRKSLNASDDSDPGLTLRKPKPPRRRDSFIEDDVGEDLEDEVDDYESDLSDMEAGFSDVEEEDEKAARLARLEDDRELRALEAAKREKELRKRALADMVKKRQKT